MHIVIVGGGLVGSTVAGKLAQDGHSAFGALPYVLGRTLGPVDAWFMPAGRLEVFTLLVLVVPRFWRR